MNQTNEHQPTGKAENRIRNFMAHTTRYCFKGRSRLALDAGVSPASITQLLNHLNFNPSFVIACRIVSALEQELGRHIDPREVFCEDGRFPTFNACQVSGCKGCNRTEATTNAQRSKQHTGSWQPIPELKSGKEVYD